MHGRLVREKSQHHFAVIGLQHRFFSGPDRFHGRLFHFFQQLLNLAIAQRLTGGGLLILTAGRRLFLFSTAEERARQCQQNK
ncbi:MAG: hypothetical protein BWY83_02760 [bacterium ADurb.Bin478]|nr:MAG: hypothetical protein BWY83_02760 [bacterium ADurb.Bin478]